MRLRRISLKNFKGVDACDVTLPADGMTIIEGPNEVGKSSLADAVDLLFTFQHDSKHTSVKDAGPKGRDVGPEVEVELTTGPYDVCYGKRWLRDAETHLAIRSPEPANLVGRDAHDRMVAILEETLDRFLYDALRFVQGERIDQAAVAESTELLHALDQAAEGGAADPEAESSLWQEIEAEWARYFTPKGRPLKERETLATRLGEAGNAKVMAERALQRLDETGEELRAVSAGIVAAVGKEEAARRERDVARSDVAAVEEIGRRLAAARDSVERAGIDKARVDEAVAARADKTRLLDTVAAELDRLSAAEADAKKRRVAAEAEQEVAQHEQQEAAAVDQAARDRLVLAQNDFSFRKSDLSLVMLTERLEQARAASEDEARALRHVEEAKVTREARHDLDAALAEVARRRGARDASVASVEVAAIASVEVTVGGERRRMEAGESVVVTAAPEATVVVGDQATVTVRSAQAASELTAALASAEQALGDVVVRYGLDATAPRADLEAKLEALADAERAAEHAKRLRGNALRDLSFEELKARVDARRADVDGYPQKRAGDIPLPATEAEAERAEEVARVAMDAADERLGQARIRLGTVEATVQQCRADEMTAAALVTARTGDVGRTRGDLEAARATRTDGELAAEAERVAAALAAAEEDVQRIAAEYDRTDPTSVHARRDNAEKLVERIARERRELGERRVALEATLAAAGAPDLQDAIDRTTSEEAAIAAEYEDTERRAAAANLLYETFARHRDSARRAYVAPYKAQVDTLARVVFGPTASVEVDATNLSLRSRTIDGVAIPFKLLSTGAREQLAVLARLACAILVNPHGAGGDAGVPVILDDALGYSDPERLRRLAPAFSAAAERAQVIVMTSTSERYEHVGGATVVRLPQA